MTLNYEFGGDDNRLGDDFEFEPDLSDVRNKIRELIIEESGADKNSADTKKLVDMMMYNFHFDFDKALEEHFREPLTEAFENEAAEKWREENQPYNEEN